MSVQDQKTEETLEKCGVLPKGMTRAHCISLNDRLYLFGDRHRKKSNCYMYEEKSHSWRHVSSLPRKFYPWHVNFQHWSQEKDEMNVFAQGRRRGKMYVMGMKIDKNDDISFHPIHFLQEELPLQPMLHICPLSTKDVICLYKHFMAVVDTRTKRVHFVADDMFPRYGVFEEAHFWRMSNDQYLLIRADPWPVSHFTREQFSLESREPLPVALEHFGLLYLEPYVFVMGGATCYKAQDTIWYLDISDPCNKWELSRDRLPSKRSHFRPVLHKESIHILGGQDERYCNCDTHIVLSCNEGRKKHMTEAIYDSSPLPVDICRVVIASFYDIAYELTRRDDWY